MHRSISSDALQRLTQPPIRKSLSAPNLQCSGHSTSSEVRKKVIACAKPESPPSPQEPQQQDMRMPLQMALMDRLKDIALFPGSRLYHGIQSRVQDTTELNPLKAHYQDIELAPFFGLTISSARNECIMLSATEVRISLYDPISAGIELATTMQTKPDGSIVTSMDLATTFSIRNPLLLDSYMLIKAGVSLGNEINAPLFLS